MAMTRREMFKNLAKGSLPILAAGCATTGMCGSAMAEEEEKQAPPGALGLLYDATRCVGCKSCMVACVQANDLQPDTRTDGLHQAPPALNYQTKNIIKLYRTEDGSDHSYFKQQCMHCVDPGCINACMFGGLHKDEETGVVWWNGKYCVGCRYCEIACPYHIPAFQWDGFNPKIVKCELCRDHIAKGASQPGCTQVCPTHAVIYGRRDELLKEAKRRIMDNPGRYYKDKVYGETEGGGTQVLYLSRVGFDKLGLPSLGTESIPNRLRFQHRVYRWMVIPAAIYTTMVFFATRNFKEHMQHVHEESEQTGVREQL
jgi:Fe-S-cluster-containing dehydrogenase component